MGEWTTKVLESMQSNPYIWLIIAVCSIIGVPAFFYSVYSQHKNSKKKELSFRKSSITIISNKVKFFEELKVIYSGQEVDNLSATRFIVWNSGNKEIRKDDIVNDRPLTIKASGDTKILSAEIVNENEKSNHFSLYDTDLTTVRLKFDYIDSNEGAVIGIIHTGNPSDIKMDCKIMGGEEIKQDKEWFLDKGFALLLPIRSYKMKHFLLSLIVTFLSIIFVLDILAIAGIAQFENHQTTDADLIAFWIMFAIIGGALFCYTKALVSSIKTVRLKKRLFQNN